MGRNHSLVVCSAVVCAGCTVGPEYHRPAPVMPSQWAELSAATTRPEANPVPDGALAASVPTVEAHVDLAQWWRTLGDPVLDRLIDRAIGSNIDLRMAEARIREVRAQRDIVASNRYPGVGTSVSYLRQQPSQNGQLGEVADGPIGFLGAGTLVKPYDLFQAGFDASWEVDLFGGVRRSIEAADASTAGAVEQRRDLLVSVVAEVARVYVGLRGAQRRLAIAQANLAAERVTLELVRQKCSAGTVTELDVTRAEAQVTISESQIPLFTRHIGQAIHALSVLLAEDNSILSEELAGTVPLPQPPVYVPVGLPADLLRRRPDIRQAERTLAAATAQVGVATADLFPRFSLNGMFKLESISLESWGSWDSRTSAFGPAVRWPIFDGGRIRANIRVQNARQEQALARYERVVLNAIREVEDALIGYITEQSRRRSLAQSVEAGTEAVELAQYSYEGGMTDLLAVLDARRALYDAEDALAESDHFVVMTLIALYKGLGGGWDCTDAKWDAQVEPSPSSRDCEGAEEGDRSLQPRARHECYEHPGDTASRPDR